MKRQWGRWHVDTETLTMSYENGGLLQVFTVPPKAELMPSEVLDWIARSRQDAPLAEDDVRDLKRALGDILGIEQGSPVLKYPGKISGGPGLEKNAAH